MIQARLNNKTDADTFFNAHGVSIQDVVDRFHRLTNTSSSSSSSSSSTTTTTSSTTKIVFSAEPACWIGFTCRPRDIAKFYPHVTQRSSCNQFLNSGQYMGYANDIRQMVQELLLLSKDLSPWFPKQERIDDQGLATVWYSKYNQYSTSPTSSNTSTAPRVLLDIDAVLFRSLVLGKVNASLSRGATMCGPTMPRCASTQPEPTIATWNDTTMALVLEPMESCPQVEPYPFSIHGNGVAKWTLVQFLNKYLRYVCDGEGAMDRSLCRPLWDPLPLPLPSSSSLP